MGLYFSICSTNMLSHQIR